MTTMTHEARHPALIDRMLELLLEALAMVSPPAAAEEDDIDWEDGEPEDETRAPPRLGQGADILDDPAVLCRLVLMGRIAPGFGDPRFVPLLHRRQRQQPLGIVHRLRLELQAVGLHPERDRAKNASTAEKAPPARNGPPKRLSPSVQSALIRLMSRCKSAETSLSSTRMPTVIPQTLRRVEKPECISAAADRAQARAILSAGQT